MKNDNPYLHFYILSREIDEAYGMDTTEVRVLNLITTNYFSRKKINISTIIAHKEIASPASIHAALKKLIKKKLLVMTFNEDDERVKYPEPSEVALTRLKKLNKFF